MIYYKRSENFHDQVYFPDNKLCNTYDKSKQIVHHCQLEYMD